MLSIISKYLILSINLLQTELLLVKSKVIILCTFQNYPPDVASCMLVIEQALSIRALQEMVAAAGNEAVWILMCTDDYLDSLTEHSRYYRVPSLDTGPYCMVMQSCCDT